MSRIKKPKFSNNTWILLISGIFCLFYFFYFYFRINPALIYQAQQPAFFWHWPFMRGFFTYPGGPLELFGALWSQFFYYAWSGALLFAVLFGLIALLGHLYIKAVHSNRAVLFSHWAPTILLFILHHDYDFPLAVTLGMALAILANWIFIRFGPRHFSLRGILFLVLYGLLYWIAAGPAFLFAVISVLFEVFDKKNFVLPLIYLVVAAIVPFLGRQYIFILPAPHAWLNNLGLLSDVTQSWALYLLLLFFPALYILNAILKKRDLGSWQQKYLVQRPNLVIASQLALLLIALALSAMLFFPKRQKALLATNYYAQHRQWDKVIAAVQHGGLFNTYIGLFQFNRALYHSGHLCESMFAFPQHLQLDGLFLHESVRHLFPLQYSDLYYDLGLINEAQHWAHEALSVTGDTPWNLQRLALANILKNENAAAQKCLLLLRKTMWHKKSADRLLDALEQNDFSLFPELQQRQALMPTSDFIVIPGQPEACLEELLNANNQNKMAFEYHMAGLLLDGKVGRFMKYLDDFSAMNYSKTPRHFEEAILLYVLNTGRRDFDAPKTGISPNSLKAFREYVEIMNTYQDPASAYRELAPKFSGTFWYYASYIYKKDG